jgi:hypothetical protein
MRKAGLLLLFTLCTACSTLSSRPLEDFDGLGRAAPIPPVAAQGVSLFHSLSRGLNTQSIRDLEMASFTVEDFDGRPFTYINFTSPTPIGDVWTFADQLTGKEWSLEEEHSPYRTVITGASKQRSVVTAMTTGVELIRHIGITVRALGGKEKLERLVTLNGLNDVMAQDKNGSYWQVSDQPKIISDLEIRTAKAQYLATRQRNNDPELIRLLEEEWNKILEPRAPGTKATTSPNPSSLTRFTRGDGNLDLTKAASSLAKLGGLRMTSSGLKPQFLDVATQDCWPFLWWYYCDPSWYGHLKRSKIPGGFLQAGSNYNLPVFQVPTAPGYGPANTMGCGPASFVSLAHWWNEYENRRWYGKTATGITPYYSTVANAGAYPISFGNSGNPYALNSFAVPMATMQPNGLPLITAHMGGFWFVSGTLVTPQGYIDGGNAWLVGQRGSNGIPNSMRVTGFYNVTPGIWGPFAFFGALSANANVFNFSRALREQTGYADRPIIAVYPTGGGAGLEAHYSPVLRFHLIEGALATVWVNPLDQFVGNASWEVNLGNVGSIAAGVFYLEP